MGAFDSVEYDGHFYLVRAVRDVTTWRHNHVSKQTFWRSLLTQYAYSSARTLHILCVIALNINNQRFKLGYRRKINSTLIHSKFITAKISGGAFKLGSETHSSILRQSALLVAASERFATAKSGCTNVSSNTSSREQKACGWSGCCTSRFARSNLAKLHKNWECE